MTTRFFYSDTVRCREQAVVCSLSLCCFWLCEIFDSDSLAGIRFVIRMPRRRRDLHITNKAVINHDPLRAILAGSLRFKHINVVDQLSQQRRCQVVHLHKSPHGENETLPLLLLLSGFRQLLAKGGDLAFQLYSLHLIFMGQLHAAAVFPHHHGRQRYKVHLL